MQETSKNLIVINIASFIMSFSGLFAKWISLESYGIIFGRSLTALPVLCIVCFMFNIIKPIQTKRHMLIIAISSILITIHWVLFYMAIQLSSVAVGVIALLSYPLISSILEPLLTKTPYNIRCLIESSVLIISIALLSGHTINGDSIYFGIMLGLIAATCFALRNIIIKEIVNEYSPIWLMLIQIGVSVIILAPIGIVPLMAISAKDALLIAVAGIIVVALSHIMFIQSMKTLYATTVGIIASLQLVYAIIASWWFFNETLSINILLGGILILSVSIFEQIKGYKENTKLVS